ncbi:hypothetical protein PIB30_024708 [Stylosanthes scabra]|uniref:Uncharacterized protein n=1 Tax=Stylosanthes scabra TaxID=79078 RepID=A0ABU6RA26_9FABA|nr:hypothetical protein [Stylosanthes scabra]
MGGESASNFRRLHGNKSIPGTPDTTNTGKSKPIEMDSLASGRFKNTTTPSPNHHHLRHSHLHLKPLIVFFSSSTSSSSSSSKVVPPSCGRTLVFLKFSSFLSKVMKLTFISS